jgi:hypothetical protein
MAFKFKVKKRPSMGQAVAASFASGVGQGIQAGGQAALQHMIKERAAKKDSANKELNTFNNLISGLPQTPENRASILRSRVSIMKGDINAIDAMDAIGLSDIDYQTVAEVRQNRKDEESIEDRSRIISERKKKDEKISTKEMVVAGEALDASVKRKLGMGAPTPTPLEVEQRTAQSRLNLGLTTASPKDKITKNQELNALEEAIKGAKTSMILANNDPVKKEAIQKQLTKFEARRDTLLLDSTISSKPKIDY